MKMKIPYLVLLLLLIVACGGDQGALPPSRPHGTVSGNAIAAEIKNGMIAVYSLDRSGKGALLASGTTDAKGYFKLDLQAASQPVVIELTGGQYTEESSDVGVDISDGQVLRAVALYKSGHPLSVMVTPFTQIAAGLAQYQIGQGKDPAAAVESALSDVTTLTGIPVDSVIPRNITDSDGATTELTAAYSYGFLLAAISSFTRQVSQQNGMPVHTTYTSIGLAQVMYNDVVSDGLLDGRGLNKTGSGLMDLSVGTVALNQNVYRIALAEHLLAVSDSSQNKTGLVRSDLLDLAHSLSTSVDPLFGGKSPDNSAAFAPDIVPVLKVGSAISGINNFSVNISSISGAESVSFTIDGVTTGGIIDPANPEILINTSDYTTGSHTIGVSVTDFLGLSSHEDFIYHFGNVFINVASVNATNKTPFTLTGSYDDHGAGFQSLTVQGNPVTPNGDKTWSAQVDLVLGRNHIPVVFEAADGTSDHVDVVVDYDVGLPAIDTSAGHGSACFSNGDGTCTQQVLADTNLVTPVSIETDHTELSGVAETRTALSSNNIPFFAFTTSDIPSDGVSTPADELKVRFQYEKNSVVVVPWTSLIPSSGEYLVPLVTEFLSNTWLHSVPDDIQKIRIQVEDLAGNVADTVFNFKVEFVVAPITIDSDSDSGAATFSGVSFDQRANLFNTTLTAVEYRFTNSTGKSFYLSLSDTSVHTVDNLIDELVRENSVRLKTSTEWRAGFIENLLNGSVCPSMPKDSANNDKWTPITQILNYVGDGTWYPETVPVPTLGAIESALSDIPAAPSPGAWSQLADFDSSYATVTNRSVSFGISVSYRYDYILDSSHLDQPTAIHNYSINQFGATRNCSDLNFLQQRQVFIYQSEPGYPKNTASIVNDSVNFSTSGFTVFDETASVPISDISGWYLIPATHTVVIGKQVTLPALTLHNDIDVADPASFTSYSPHLYDHTLTWTINRALNLKVSPDGGVDNISYMSSRDIPVGVGSAVYQVSR